MSHKTSPRAATDYNQTPSTFSISKLPYELRQLIYKQYLSSLSALPITPLTTKTPHHNHTPLSLASPFLTQEITPWLFYTSIPISFSCPQTLIKFSLLNLNKENIRRIRIEYGEITSHFVTPDWVFLVLSRFEKAVELVFVVEMGNGGEKGDGLFGSWWKCVLDAVREGMGVRGGRMSIRVVDGEEQVLEEKSVRRC